MLLNTLELEHEKLDLFGFLPLLELDEELNLVALSPAKHFFNGLLALITDHWRPATTVHGAYGSRPLPRRSR